MNTIVANTKAQQRKGLTGAPKGSVGIFNYMDLRPRRFVRTDRDLEVIADGQKVGELTEENQEVIVPPAKKVVEKPMVQYRKGGKSLYSMLCR